MVTISIPNATTTGGYTACLCRGYSTDAKPTLGIPVNSMFVELDTGKVFYFTGAQWKEFGEE